MEYLDPKIVFFLSVLFILSATQRTIAQKGYFIPPPLVIPTPGEHEQINLSAGLGRGYEFGSVFTNKHFVLFSTASRNNWATTKAALLDGYFRIKRNDYSIQGGAGYFYSLASNGEKQLGLIAGAGYFEADNYWYFTDSYDYIEFTKASYHTIFLQLNYLIKKRKHEFTYGARLEYIGYNNFLFYDVGPSMSSIQSRYYDVRTINLEPVINYSFLFHQFKISLQGGFSYPINNPYVEKKDFEMWTNPPTVSNPTTEQFYCAAFIGSISFQYTLRIKQ